jgi:hypothetical protein
MLHRYKTPVSALTGANKSICKAGPSTTVAAGPEGR